MLESLRSDAIWIIPHVFTGKLYKSVGSTFTSESNSINVIFDLSLIFSKNSGHSPGDPLAHSPQYLQISTYTGMHSVVVIIKSLSIVLTFLEYNTTISCEFDE